MTIPSGATGIPPTPDRGFFSLLPGLWILRHYRRAWFFRDLSAGLVLTSLLVPAGMGYATASGLPAVCGLYATIVPLLAYALVGPSRILVLGPDSALAGMVAATVVSQSHGVPERAIALASMLALLTGALSIAAGFAKVGFLTDLLSKPVRVGYLNGIALTVVVTQLPKLLGFSVGSASVLGGLKGLIVGLLAGQAKAQAVTIGVPAAVAILILQKLAPRIPVALATIVVSTLVVSFSAAGTPLDVVGPVPRGMPLPSVPMLEIADVGPLAAGAVGICLVSFADTSVLSRTYAGKLGLRVDPNRELIGLGIANLFTGFFRGFPVSGSASRTPVAEASGARTQLTGFVGALAVFVLLVVAPGALRNVPVTALAAVVICAVLRILDVSSLKVFFRVRRSDFYLSVASMLAVVALGVLPGIAVAVTLSLLDFVRRAWKPHDAILGRAHGLKGYHDVERYPEAKQVPGLILFRWDAPLFFANADTFRKRVLDVLEAAPQTKWVVIAAEPVTDVDTTAAEVLQELDTELAARGVELAFAEMKDPVKDRLAAYGLHKQIGGTFFFPTIGVAVKAYLRGHDVPWIDWDDES